MLLRQRNDRHTKFLERVSGSHLLVYIRWTGGCHLCGGFCCCCCSPGCLQELTAVVSSHLQRLSQRSSELRRRTQSQLAGRRTRSRRRHRGIHGLARRQEDGAPQVPQVARALVACSLEATDVHSFLRRARAVPGVHTGVHTIPSECCSGALMTYREPRP